MKCLSEVVPYLRRGYAVLGPGRRCQTRAFGNPESTTHYNDTVTLRAVYDYGQHLSMVRSRHILETNGPI